MKNLSGFNFFFKLLIDGESEDRSEAVLLRGSLVILNIVECGHGCQQGEFLN